MFQKIFDARVRDLWELYKATGELGHRGEKGLLREIFLKRILESVLPPHFGIGGGIIVDKWSRQSPQVDIIIYDRRRMPPIMEESGHGIYPMDAVLRIIEVKSTLDRNALIQFKTLMESVNPKNPKGLKLATSGNLEGGQSYYPLVGLFAYTSAITRIKEMLTDIGGFEERTPQICVITHGSPFYDDREGFSDLGMEANLRFFLAKILGVIEDTASSRKEFSIIEWLF